MLRRDSPGRPPPAPLQHLAALLAADDSRVVEAALKALASLVRRSSTARGSRWQDSLELASRLRPLSAGLAPPFTVRCGRGERETRSEARSPASRPPPQGLGLFTCSTGLPKSSAHSAPTPEAVAAACALKFEFYAVKVRTPARLAAPFAP